jgi:imidazolonepropionase-like amidohydrolase
MQILACTTANAARMFGGETGRKIGALEVGKLADLVLLNSDPAADIARASDIDRVIKNGVVYPAKDLESAPR